MCVSQRPGLVRTHLPSLRKKRKRKKAHTFTLRCSLLPTSSFLNIWTPPLLPEKCSFFKKKKKKSFRKSTISRYHPGFQSTVHHEPVRLAVFRKCFAQKAKKRSHDWSRSGFHSEQSEMAQSKQHFRQQTVSFLPKKKKNLLELPCRKNGTMRDGSSAATRSEPYKLCLCKKKFFQKQWESEGSHGPPPAHS